MNEKIELKYQGLNDPELIEALRKAEAERDKYKPYFDRCMDCPIVCVKAEYLDLLDERDVLKNRITKLKQAIHGRCAVCMHFGMSMTDANSPCLKANGTNFETNTSSSYFVDCEYWEFDEMKV